MARAARLLAILLALGAGLLAVGLWLAAAARPWLERSLGEAAGRPVRIVGAVRPLVALYPGLVLGDVRIDNPPGSAEPVLLEVAALEARLDLPALLRGDLRVRGVRLRNGRLVVGGALPADAAAESEPPAALALLTSLAGEQRLRNLQVEFVLEDGARTILELEQARLRACGEPASARARLGATAIELEGTLLCPAQGPALHDAVARLGDSELRGRLALHFESRGLRIEADADTEALLVDDLLAVTGDLPGDEEGSFLDAPLPGDAFEDLDVDLTLRAGAVYADAGVVRELDARLRADAAGLRATVLGGLVAEGSLAGELQLDSAQEPPAARLELTLDAARLDLLAPDTFAGGTATLDLELRSSGATPRSLLAGASGRSQLTLSEALLIRESLGPIGRDLFSLLPSKDRAERNRRVSCGVLRATLDAGTGAVLAVFDTPDTSLAGGGSFDLESLTGDLLLKPRPRRASLGAVKTPIRISGPLDALQVAVDKGELAKAAGKALGTSLLNPLVALVDLGVRGDPCREAIDQALGGLAASEAPPPDDLPASNTPPPDDLPASDTPPPDAADAP